MSSAKLEIGSERGDKSPVELKLDTLLRHFMALGSSGSGKTVLSKIVVEEVVRSGVPAICIDPQGDLCSLALAADDPEKLASKGVDPDVAKVFNDKADVVVFTPASRKGVSLSADPIRIDPTLLSARERVHAFTATATMVVSLLGYDLGGDDGEGLVAVFDRGLNLLYEQGRYPHNLAEFTEYWLHLDDTDRERYGRYLNDKKIDQACRKLARLDVGARRLLFHEGIPLDMDMLLGRDKRALEGKTRISVIYLNTLHSQEDKEYFVAALTQQLYTWMLDNPSKKPQALFYIDEVAPYVPPVRKPACKDSLTLLFKQARKYGVSCLMATQNPADVDYKAMAQFGTWALGRMTTRQDMKKVQPTVKSLDPVNVDSVMEQLPAQKPGQFLLISPDNFDATRAMNTRWLYTQHETLDEERIEQLADERWRERFRFDEAVSDKPKPAPKASPVMPKKPKSPPPDAEAEKGQSKAKAERGDPEKIKPEKAKSEKPKSEKPKPQQPAQDPALLKYSKSLSRSTYMTAAEFSRHARLSESKARSTLKKLVAEGLAGRFKEGRSMRYWAKERGLRPDLGLMADVKAMVPHVDRAEAERIGANLRESGLLGLVGGDEELVDLQLEYRPLYRIRFQEKVRKSLFKRLFSRGDFDHRSESVYLHPRNLQLVVFHPNDGLFLDDKPEEHASEIEDFDGVARFEKLAPGGIHIDEHEWGERVEDEKVMDAFLTRYEVRPKGIEPVFLPVWRLHLRRPGKPGTRIVTIDALSGFSMEW